MPSSKKAIPSKAETSLLTPFTGLTLAHIHVPRTEAEFAAATAAIKAAKIVGFDTESKPTFSIGEVSEGPHIVQFACPDQAFIFQLHHAACRPCLIDLLQSEAVLKVGFGLASDRGQIHAKFGVTLKAVLDVNTIFRKDGYRGDMGVRAAVGAVLQQRFHKSKKVTTSNWSLPNLSDSQLLYAANDAYAALAVITAMNLQAGDL